jgi:hypothetical protein
MREGEGQRATSVRKFSRQGTQPAKRGGEGCLYARPQSRFDAIAAPSTIAPSFLNEMSGSILP